MSITPYTEPHAPAVAESAQSLVQWAQSADAAYSLAQKLVSTSFCPQQFRGKPQEAAAAMLAGAEVGLSPMAALRSFDVIQGTAAPRALTLRAVAQSHGAEFVTVEEGPEKVVMRGRRTGGGDWETVTWTIKRAQQMGLTGKDNWKKQPQSMLIARATSDLARRIAADAILGIGYSAEELEDEATSSTKITRPATSKISRAKKSEPEPEPTTSHPDAGPEDTPIVDAISRDRDEAAEAAPSQAQIGRMFALFGEVLTDVPDARTQEGRAARLAYISAVIDRQVESSKDLTVTEVSAVIDSLQADKQATPAPEDIPDEQFAGLAGEPSADG